MPERRFRNEEVDCMPLYRVPFARAGCMPVSDKSSDSLEAKDLTFDIGAASEINIKAGLTGDEVIIADNEFIQKITDATLARLSLVDLPSANSIKCCSPPASLKTKSLKLWR